MRPYVGVALVLCLLVLGGPVLAADRGDRAELNALLARPELEQKPVHDVDGVLVKTILAPTQAFATQLVSLLEPDEFVVCSSMGECRVVRVPFSQKELSVVNGSCQLSARVCYNADAPGQPLWTFDKGYGRTLRRPLAAGERRWDLTDWGHSWDAVGELSITVGANRCNGVAALTSAVPFISEALMDAYTCDADGQQLIVTRWAAVLIENDQQAAHSLRLPSVALPVECAPFAPVTVLPSVRTGWQVITGDGLRNAVQAVYLIGQAP